VITLPVVTNTGCSF